MNTKKKEEEKTQLSASEKKLQNIEQQVTSTNLSQNLAMELMGLIKKVNEDCVTAESVNASCNAAAQIHKILKLNYDMKKEGF